MGQLLFTKMLIKAAIFFGFISLTFAQECATVGSSCSSGCTCPTGLTCNYNAPTDMNQYCMVSTTLAAGAYCDNHFGLCSSPFVCGKTSPSEPFATCITASSKFTTTTTTGAPTTTTTTPATITTTSAGCWTSSGAMVNARCIFPFIYKGETYNSCTTAGGFSKPWCSTATTTTGQHINGYWGDCGAGCPTETTTVTTTPAPTCSTPCKFPFVYMGKVHYACTNAGGFQPAWCSTATDQYGNHIIGNFADCAVGCPVEIIG